MEPQVPGTPEVPGQPPTQARERLSLTQLINILNKIVNKINNNLEKKYSALFVHVEGAFRDPRDAGGGGAPR